MRCVLSLAFVACLLAAPAIEAQTYPTKPIRLVAPAPQGGGIDLLARMFGERIAQGLGQPVAVENRLGAAGNIGVAHVARSAPDGYTLLVMTDGIVTNSILFKAPEYEPFRDFQPVSLLTRNSWVLAVTNKLPARTLNEFIALAKSKPRGVEYATAGIGSPHHLTGELFQSTTGVELLHVPYKGVGQFLPDLVSGQVQATFNSLPSLLPYIASGKLRAIGVWSANRVSLAPEIATMAEQGLSGSEVFTWHGLFAPAGTPREIVSRLNGEVQKVLSDQEWVASRLTKNGFEKVGSSPEELLDAMKTSRARWGRIVKEANIPLQ
jgi:tripartite-type tricarboxylate transporter receptor subunit TctC